MRRARRSKLTAAELRAAGVSEESVVKEVRGRGNGAGGACGGTELGAGEDPLRPGR